MMCAATPQERPEEHDEELKASTKSQRSVVVGASITEHSVAQRSAPSTRHEAVTG